MYKELHFNGYKSFPAGQTTTLSDIKRCNIIIGKNNSGKSSLLDVVATSVDQNYFGKYGKAISDLEASFLVDQNSIGTMFSQYSSINGIYHPHSYAQRAIGELYRVRIEGSGTRARYSMSQNDNTFFQSSALGGRWGDLANNISRNESNVAFRRISAERNIVPESEDYNEQLSEDGRGASNLIRKFVNHSRYDETLVEQVLLRELNVIMQPEIEFEEIKIQQIGQEGALLWEVFLREKGCGRYALSQSGSGLKTVVLVLLNLLVLPHANGYIGKTIVYGFEELENNLHPALQRRLFDYLYEFSIENNTHIFLTTHSHIAINAFFDKEEASIYHVVKGEAGSVVKKIDNYIDKVEILDDLDVKASDLLQSNGIIWVEGPSDRVYIKHWLKTFCDSEYVEGRDYQFMYYGGRLLSHYSAEQTRDLVSILTTNRHAAIVIDSDKRNRQASINETKKRIVQEFKDHELFSWVTKGKEIENYVPAKAVSETFECGDMEECGQYELFPDYIKAVYPNFTSKKILFANAVTKNITRSNSMDRFDLQSQIEKLYEQIRKWNA